MGWMELPLAKSARPETVSQFSSSTSIVVVIGMNRGAVCQGHKLRRQAQITSQDPGLVTATKERSEVLSNERACLRGRSTKGQAKPIQNGPLAKMQNLMGILGARVSAAKDAT